MVVMNAVFTKSPNNVSGDYKQNVRYYQMSSDISMFEKYDIIVHKSTYIHKMHFSFSDNNALSVDNLEVSISHWMDSMPWDIDEPMVLVH